MIFEIDDLMRAVLTILPNASLGEDNDGQLIIYTNLRVADGTTRTAAGELENIPEDAD